MLTAERLREVLSYDPLTGLFTWLVSRGKAKAGNAAGVLTDSGYVVIGVDSVRYYAHRLAWLYMKGEWPAGDLDHDNVRSDDNRWDNLRPATESQNGANRRVQRNNKLGVKGVCVHKVRKDRIYGAHIEVGGRSIYLGYFDTSEGAHAAYALAALKHFGDFART